MGPAGIGYRKLFEIVERMYAATSVEDLHRTIVGGMMELVGGDTYELVVCGTPSEATDLYLTKPDTFTEDEKLFGLSHAGEHPIVKAIAAGASGVLSVSQCSSDREWMASALFQDGGYHRQGLRREVAVQLPGVTHLGLATFSMARGNPDFSAGELELLGWVAPHIARAWRQVQRRSHGPSPSLIRNLYPVLSAREAEILFWVIEGKRTARSRPAAAWI